VKNDADMTKEEFVRKYVRKSEFSYRIITGLMFPLTWLLYHAEYYGVENIPEDGPVIITCNHRGVPDPAFVIYAYRKRAIRFLAKKSLHDSIFGFIFRMTLTIPVDRSRKAPEAILAAEAILDNNGVVGIFPEGTRNKSDDVLLPFKFGAVALAQKCQAYLVPCVNVGTYRPFLDKVKTYFGEAYKIAPDADLKKENEILRQKMADLYIKYATDDPKVQRILAAEKENK
jgi:1-acyl-sn-glycerol-3-phosphate acyltransferase